MLMECEKQAVAQSNKYPTAPAGDPYPPPYAACQNPHPGGMAHPQGPPYQINYNQPYPSPQQPYGDAGYQSASQKPYYQSGYPGAGYGPPAYGYPAPGAAGYGQQPQMVVMAPPQPQTVVVWQSSVSMTGAIVMSCFVFWCCGCPCGLVAFILALFGQSSSSSGNAKFATQLRNVSYGISIVGIIVPVIVFISVLVYIFFFKEMSQDPNRTL